EGYKRGLSRGAPARPDPHSSPGVLLDATRTLERNFHASPTRRRRSSPLNRGPFFLRAPFLERHRLSYQPPVNDDLRRAIEEIKLRTPIEDLVRERVPSLKKRGRLFEACCPFHEE